MNLQLIVKEYIIAETTKEDLTALITEFFGENYDIIVRGSDWTYVFKKIFLVMHLSYLVKLHLVEPYGPDIGIQKLLAGVIFQLLLMTI